MGDALYQKIASQRLFMIGCGAIGCEMIKNLAMLGVGVNGGKVGHVIGSRHRRTFQKFPSLKACKI